MKYSWPGHHGWEHHQFIKKGEGEHPHPIGIEPEWAITHASALASDLPPSSLELQLSLVQLLNPNNGMGVFQTLECFSKEAELEAYPESTRAQIIL
jgi:hypothetical protein